MELYRRKLQYALDRLRKSQDAEEKFSVIHKQCMDYIGQFQKESEYGRNEKMITLWDKKIAQELDFVTDKKIPPFTLSKYGYGANFCFGTSFFTGSLGETFTPTFNVDFGLEFGYKNSIFSITSTYGGNSVKKNLQSNQNWYSGQKSNFGILDLSYGYCLLENDKIKLTPFAGLGITEFNGENKIKDGPDISIIDYNLLIGLTADYKIKKFVNLIRDPFFGITDYSEPSIHARLYISRSSFADDLKGYSINLAVGMSLVAKSLKLD
ncbi:MAG: hypothetical protein WCR42_11925 [bacterium]